MSSTDLKSSPWFRLISVIYVITYIVVVLIVLGLAYSEKPTKVIDYSNSSIQCNNGKSYYFNGKNNLSWYDLVSLQDNDTSYNDSDERDLCMYGVDASGKAGLDSIFGVNAPTPATQNYRLSIEYTTSGSWSESEEILLFGLIGTFLFFEIVRRLFLYVTDKKII